MTDRTQIVGIGNALVDVIAHVEDAFLAEHGVPKGAMRLVDDATAARLYAAMPPAREVSGGSAANTIAGLAALGVRAAYVGKVADDQLGRIFAHDLRAMGVRYAGPVVANGAGAETGRSLILVTPDAERSMNTSLGVSASLAPGEVDRDLLGGADWLYLEGYLYDLPAAKDAYAEAVRAARAGGAMIAFTVSDSFCVERHRADMRALVREHVDLLFANRFELMALYGSLDLAEAVAAATAEVGTVAVTLSEEGALVASGATRLRVPAVATRVVDTTGAGDLFAAGFLAGAVRGRGPEDCARMGCIAAGEVIGHVGARPEADLAALMAASGL